MWQRSLQSICGQILYLMEQNAMTPTPQETLKPERIWLVSDEHSADDVEEEDDERTLYAAADEIERLRRGAA